MSGAIVVLALAMRLVLAAEASRERIDGDPAYYDQVAASVAAGHGWPRLSRRLRVDPHGQPTALHPPAWPYLLAATYVLTGHDTRLDQGPAWLTPRGTAPSEPARAAAQSRWRAARVVNALLGSIAVGLIALVAAALWGRTVALVAAALAAVYPPLAVLGVALFSEPLFIVLELAALLAVLRHRSSAHRLRWVVAAGVLTGLAVLTRTNGAALVVPFALAVWTGRPRWSASALAAPAVLIAVAALTVAPWTVRNIVVLDSPVPVSTNLGKTLAGTYNPVARGHRFRWITGRLLPRSYRPALRQPTEVARSSALTRLALHYVADHPVDVARAAVWNTARLAELDPVGRSILAAALGSEPLARISVAGFALAAPLAAAGVLTARARRAPPWLWLIPLLMGLSAVLIAVNFSRFRAPIDPFLIMLCALTLTAAGERLARRRRAGSTSHGSTPGATT